MIKLVDILREITTTVSVEEPTHIPTYVYKDKDEYDEKVRKRAEVLGYKILKHKANSVNFNTKGYPKYKGWSNATFDFFLPSEDGSV